VTSLGPTSQRRRAFRRLLAALAVAIASSACAGSGPAAGGDCNQLFEDFVDAGTELEEHEASGGADSAAGRAARLDFESIRSRMEELGCRGFIGELEATTTTTLPKIDEPEVCDLEADSASVDEDRALAADAALRLDDVDDSRFFGYVDAVPVSRSRRGRIFPGSCTIVEEPRTTATYAVEFSVQPDPGEVPPIHREFVAVFEDELDADAMLRAAREGDLGEAARVDWWITDGRAAFAESDELDEPTSDVFIPSGADGYVEIDDFLSVKVLLETADGVRQARAVTLLRAGRVIALVETIVDGAPGYAEEYLAWTSAAAEALRLAVQRTEDPASPPTTITGADARSAAEDLKRLAANSRVPDEVLASVYIPSEFFWVSRDQLTTVEPDEAAWSWNGYELDIYEFIEREWPNHGWEQVRISGLPWRFTDTDLVQWEMTVRIQQGPNLLVMSIDECDSCPS
jgi:hypothetical protein